MTLNQLVSYAEKEGLDFDAPILMENSNSMEQSGYKEMKSLRPQKAYKTERSTRDAFDGGNYSYTYIGIIYDQKQEEANAFSALLVSEY